MAGAITSTARGTNNINAKRMPIDMSSNITLLDPEVAPLLVISKKLKTEAVSNYKFEWMEDDYMARWVTVQTPVADGVATSVVLASGHGARLAVDDLVKVPATGEVFRVTAISTDTLTVVRGYGETTAAAIAGSAQLLVMGNAIMQGADTPAEKYNDITPMYNYTQIFRTPFSVTGTLDKTKQYANKTLLNELRAKKGIEHKKDLETAFLFGERKLDTSGAQPRSLTGGILRSVTAGSSNNISKAKTSVTQADLNEWAKKLFSSGSSERLVLSSPTFIQWINDLAMGKLQLSQSDSGKKFGLSIYKYLTPFGELNLVNHKMLQNAYDGYAVALDMSDLKYRPLTGRDTKLLPNRQAAGEDGIREEYLTEAGLELRHAQHHGIFTLT